MGSVCLYIICGTRTLACLTQMSEHLLASLMEENSLVLNSLFQAHSQHCHLHGCGTSGVFVSSSAYYVRAFFWNSKRITSTRVGPTKKTHLVLPLSKYFSFQRKSWAGFKPTTCFFQIKVLPAKDFHFIFLT